MHALVHEISPLNSSHNGHSISESAEEAAKILSDTTQCQIDLFSTWSAAELAECLSQSAWHFAPGGPDYLVSNAPSLFLGHCQRAVATASESVAIAFRAQQQMFEWVAQPFKSASTSEMRHV